MVFTTTWKHTFTNYKNLKNINISGYQHLEIFQPLATNQIRIQINNLYDEEPLHISKIEIYSDPSQKRIVTVDGLNSFHVEPRLLEWSDWIDLPLLANSTLKIDIYSPNKTVHTAGLTISNDLVQTVEKDPKLPKYFFGISEIQVVSSSNHQKIAFFGDSLTNQGNFSAPLAKELESNFHIMTANYGLSGNRLLRPGNSKSEWSDSFGEAGLTRFDHMLIDYQPNLVIFMEGINDLLHPGAGAPMSELPTAEAVLKAIQTLKQKCRQHNVKFVPMTITPTANNIELVSGWNNEKENLRQTINKELLKMPHIIDLATLVGQTNQLESKFDCGDHVHFSIEGGQIIAKFIKEQLIRKKMI